MSLQINKIISSVIQIGTMLGLMCLTLMNMEIRWCEADMVLAYAILVLGVVGLACLWMNKGSWECTWIDYTAGIWMTYWVMRVWIGGEYPCATSFLQMCWMCLLYVVLRMVFVGCTYTLLYIGAVLILVFGAIESFWGFWQIINETSRHGVFLLTGNFLNPGPYSAYPMMGAIAGISLHDLNFNPNTNFFQPSSDQVNADLKRYFGIVVEVLTLICLMVLPATWSRAAWVGVGVVALWLYRQRYWKWRWYVWGGLLALAIVVFFVKQGSAEGRLIIWTAALSSWCENPICGVGYGGFNEACAEGIASLYRQDSTMFSGFQSAGVAEYSYNTLLQILVEQGLVGALFCITLVVAVLHRTYRLCRPLLYVLVSMMLFSFFSYPQEILPYRILLTMQVAVIASVSCDHVKEKHSSGWKPALAVVMVLALWFPLQSETERRNESDEGFRLIWSMKDSCFLKDYRELFPNERDNSIFLFDMAQLLQCNGRYRDSNAILQQGARISRDPMFYVLMGNNYKSMGFPERADSAYVKAFQILPNRMYPLYQRMLLQQELGNTDLMQILARQIVEMKPKIKSPATEEMQEKARLLLQ